MAGCAQDLADDAVCPVVQPNGKIVVAGSATYYVPPEGEGYGDFAIVRFNADGRLDSTFGGDGKVSHGFKSALCGRFSEAGDLALQPDGKIVVGGTTGCSETFGAPSHPGAGDHAVGAERHARPDLR